MQHDSRQHALDSHGAGWRTPPPDSSPSPPDATTAIASSPALSPSTIAVVVIAYNRPDYLDRALKSIFARHPRGDAYLVYVSQDGDNQKVADVIAKHGARRLVHPRRTLSLAGNKYLQKFPGYAYLSVHYGWALRTLFNVTTSAAADDGAAGTARRLRVLGRHHPRGGHRGRARLLRVLHRDGAAPRARPVAALRLRVQRQRPGRRTRATRPPSTAPTSSPASGGSSRARLWDELNPKWPEERGFWDDWLREPPQRQQRASIRPEVSRTYTFGAKGTSVGLFYGKFLATIELNREVVDWSRRDVTYLTRRATTGSSRGGSRTPRR